MIPTLILEAHRCNFYYEVVWKRLLDIAVAIRANVNKRTEKMGFRNKKFCFINR
jgi:hypothetical protein